VIKGSESEEKEEANKARIEEELFRQCPGG